MPIVSTTAAFALAPCVALLVDRCWGEPPARLHPVVWMGHYLQALGRRIAPVPDAPAAPHRRLAAGALAWSLLMVVVAATAWSVQTLLLRWAPSWLAAVWLGLLLKPLLAWRLLRDEVLAVNHALAQSLDAGRTQLQRLVSRDTARLDASQVRGAALSTLAENLNDSVIAPLFWFAVAGLPGAAVYRAANTADAMWGYRGVYHGRDWTWAGKWAARADDVLSWLPARLCALLLAACARRPLTGLRWRDLAREAARTPSPNGGWPMGTLALRLGVRLEKPGVYVLNPAGRAPNAGDLPLAAAICGRAAWLGAVLAALAALGVAAWGAA